MEGQATTAARALLGIPWSLKVFVGIISDCFPIRGYRRRPYMVFGWSLCALCLLTMALMPVGAPYFPDPSWRKVKPVNYTDAQKLEINHHAPDIGGKYIILMMFATLGFLIADVAADGVVVEYAQREPLAVRGRTQTAIYTVRNLFTILASIIVGFGLSSPPYGGDFDFGISFPTCMLILALCCVPVIPMTWFFVCESKVQTPCVTTYLKSLWCVIQRRSIYQVIAYSFLSGVCGGIGYVAADPATIYWARATSFTISIAQIIEAVVTVATLAATGKYGLHWNWRTLTAITTVSVIAIDSVCTMLTTWDVVRSQWFWLGLPIVEAVPSGVGFIISTYVVVELADTGNEAAIYGLMTTAGNLSGPFSSALTKATNANFNVYNDDILNDTYEARRDVTITILISYASKLLSLAFLPLLPCQKDATQRLKRTGGSSRLMGTITISYCLFALIWSILMNLFSIFESTRCLAITGGCKH
uniref:Major facilitator superfamily (MFS) profile domain-containing protein n=1 Tax=Globisporangium ultimum (strain ATCC 200006 / CBS 805.95 / DAOM BR144) TaxID=431595 RepID=K3WW90_GLOUD